MDNNKEKTIALLIDSDNLSTSYYGALMDELENLGEIRYKRVYGNFSDKKNGWTDFAIRKGITPVQVFAPVKKKNATDMLMTIDAMDIFYENTVDAFCLATNDSDFSRLAQRLKEGGMYVVVAGKENSPESLNSSCHKFVMLDVLSKKSNKESEEPENKQKNVENKWQKEDDAEEKVVGIPKLIDIKKVVSEIIEKRKREPSEFAYYAEVVAQLIKRYPQFNHKLYQAKDRQDFFINKIGCEIKLVDNTSAMIKMK